MTRAQLGFFGWDDRLGSGFSNFSLQEAQLCFRYLAITTFQSWAKVLRANGNFSEADHFDACVSAFISMHFPAALLMMRHCSVVDAFLRIRYATAAVVQARSDPEFPFGIGIHAAAEAMIGTHCTHTPDLQLYRCHRIVNSRSRVLAGGWLTANETEMLLGTLFHDVTRVCSLSGFNTCAPSD